MSVFGQDDFIRTSATSPMSSEANVSKLQSEIGMSYHSLFSLEKSEVFGMEEVSKFTRYVIIAVLSECVNELAILRSINLQNDLGSNPNKLFGYMSIEDRYMGQENHADFRINSSNNNFDKLARDINMLFLIVKETCHEIRKYGRYRVMDEAIRTIRKMHREEEQLLEEEAKQEMIIEDLKSQCEEERLENIRTIEETDSKIHQLRFQVEDIYIYGQYEVQYFDKWQKTRIEQNIMKCRDTENHSETIIKEMQRNINAENRCHKEVVSYFEETRADYLEEIQQWMKKYDEEFEQMEGDILHLRADLEKISEDRKILSERYETRQAEIDDFLKYKEIKEEKERQLMKLIMAATKIQAWWRGVMYRKQLGPYKIVKKGKGKGKDKKKGKKK